MASYNRVVLLGNVTRDPEIRYLSSGTGICNFGIATNRKFKSDGGQKEEVCFIDCAAFGRTAEVIQQFVRKGDPLLIEGRLKLDQWEKDGQKRSKHTVVVEAMQFIKSRDEQGWRNEQPSQANDGGWQSQDSDIPF